MSIRPIALILLFIVVANIHSLRSNPIYITQSENYHIVSEGETLFGISRKHSLPVEKLKLFNNLDSDDIIVGQKIYLVPSAKAKSEYVTIRGIPDEGYHIVQRGETVYRISKMYDLEIMDILSYNNLETFDIQAGQKIWLIPGQVETMDVSKRVDGDEEIIDPDEEQQYHIVSAGENLYRISLKYGMTVPQIKELNKITDDDIYVGQRLKVVGDVRIDEDGRQQRRVTKTPRKDIDYGEGSIILPLKGEVISEFGIRNNMPHNGIDIAASVGEPILAAKGGKVVFVGMQRGYGNVVVLEHENYTMTVYAHNERNLVRLGDQVRQGQPIATVGQTGNASTPHLHFEYRRKGRAINPRKVLPDF